MLFRLWYCVTDVCVRASPYTQTYTNDQPGGSTSKKPRSSASTQTSNPTATRSPFHDYRSQGTGASANKPLFTSQPSGWALQGHGHTRLSTHTGPIEPRARRGGGAIEGREEPTAVWLERHAYRKIEDEGDVMDVDGEEAAWVPLPKRATRRRRGGDRMAANPSREPDGRRDRTTSVEMTD